MKNLLDRLSLSRLPMGKLSLDKIHFDKKKKIIFIAGFIVVLLLDFIFFVNPQIRSIKAKGIQAAKLRRDIYNLNRDVATMNELRKNPEVLARTKRFISKEQTQLLLQSISDVARKYKIKIMEAKPNWTKDENLGGAKYGGINFVLSLFCDYHSLGSFFSELENMSYFITVDELKISPNPQDYLNQRVSVIIKTYVRK
ncbi:MAG: type 4a pilus biogenesis protein PilO [Candidatus Omnitrophica bacterium]|nr:type 4a pilus biogenesis protein PilO [Candidatus Omnitrophota bacterium]